MFSPGVEVLDFLPLNGQSFPSPCLYSLSDCSASVEFSVASCAMAVCSVEAIDIAAIAMMAPRAKIEKSDFGSLRFNLPING